MKERSLGLRTILTAVTACVVLVAICVSLCLSLLTARVNRSSQDLADTVESVRLANEAEIDLLVHGRTNDPATGAQTEARLRRTLVTLRSHVSTATEVAALRDVSEGAERYLASSSRGPAFGEATAVALDAAYEALERLVDINLEQARAARDRMARWSWVVNVAGVGAALTLLGLSGWFVWWLRTRAFRPVFGLLGAMERFGRGERDARAQEVGPAELRALATRFNEMAATLAAQREVQMSSLGGVAHDLRNPIAALKLSLLAARRDKGMSPHPRLEKFFALADRQLNRMERMVGDLLDSARIEAGKLDLRLERRDARDFVRDVTALFEATSPRHQVVLTVPEEEVPIRCDALRMEQVLSNLLGNAIKYSPEGGAVQVSLARVARDAVVSVTDFGIGISTKDQQRLFEPFRRVGTLSATIPGAGLGLFVAREIVTAHGGRIDVTSIPASGTTFRVHLPLSASANRVDQVVSEPVTDVSVGATERRALLPLERSRPGSWPSQ